MSDNHLFRSFFFLLCYIIFHLLMKRRGGEVASKLKSPDRELDKYICLYYYYVICVRGLMIPFLKGAKWFWKMRQMINITSFFANYVLHLMLFLDTKYSFFQNIPMMLNESRFIYHWKYDKYVIHFITLIIVDWLNINVYHI